MSEPGHEADPLTTGDPSPADLPAADPQAGYDASPAPWVGWATGTGVALAVIAALDILMVVAQGLALPARVGPLHRIGFAFGTTFNKDVLGWMALLLAVVLVTAPAFTREPTTEAQDKMAALTIAVATAFAALLAVTAVLGVLANVRLYDLAGRDLNGGVKRELAMFAFRRISTSAIVIFAGMKALSIRLGRHA